MVAARRWLIAVGLGCAVFLPIPTVRSTGDVEPVRRQLPRKCDCGCDRDFLDCNHDCKKLDPQSKTDREEVPEPVPVRLQVPPGLFPNGQWVYGTRVTLVYKGVPAEDGSTQSGGKGDRVILQVGDVITHINGAPVKNAKDYYELNHGNREVRITVIDWKTKWIYNDYFALKDGKLGIKIQPVRLKLTVPP